MSTGLVLIVKEFELQYKNIFKTKLSVLQKVFYSWILIITKIILKMFIRFDKTVISRPIYHI